MLWQTIMVGHIEELKMAIIDKAPYVPGALVARIFLQPIEESSRLFFSKTLSTGGDALPAALEMSISRLIYILLFYNHLSLLLLSLAPPFLNILVAAVLPARYELLLMQPLISLTAMPGT